MAPRANWKGFLKIFELSCAVGLYSATSSSERISFNMINRRTGNRINRIFVDRDTGKEVPRDDQTKGYEVASGEYVILDPAEIAAAVPASDKTLTVGSFVRCDEIDDVFLDKPYYLTPADAPAVEAYDLIRDALLKNKVAAIAETVLFRRPRTVLIRPSEGGLIAETLVYDYEVRDAATVFRDIPKIKISGEMLDLATHIIETKAGSFDISQFDDRYDTALAELVRAKLAGKPIPAPKKIAEPKVVDLMTALRESAAEKKKPVRKPAAKKGQAAHGT